ncbi:MAG: bifunctional nuclease family protein [Candidatus Eisenbacteria bacterium]|uniref:Bifunctional nuclease family protein n=1 Tax=Eiseniibacteriota bacterium TaxID=2212470 RepID=A0A9D6QJ82_UNCEI|nr:bifunctional nuclease family protein [Candidatus Eisenbacteria bacterium]MBI3538911.1 bifunctional nuclease family protein [Candidatus Eisenbacteria bacterium]
MKIVEARVNGLILEHKTQQNIVILRESEGQRILPIWIGPGEAQAIRRILSEEAFPRPLTHDLIHIVLEGLKAKVTRVIVADLRENTFFASIIVEREKDVLSVDARPSDAIAVALRAKAPIFVNEKLLQPAPADEPAAEESAPDAPSMTDEEKAEQLRRYLEKLNPEDFGKFQI